MQEKARAQLGPRPGGLSPCQQPGCSARVPRTGSWARGSMPGQEAASSAWQAGTTLVCVACSKGSVQVWSVEALRPSKAKMSGSICSHWRASFQNWLHRGNEGTTLQALLLRPQFLHIQVFSEMHLCPGVRPGRSLRKPSSDFRPRDARYLSVVLPYGTT